MKKKCTAIVLAAGQGKRMGSGVPKQYLPIKGKPLLYYSLKVLEDSFVDNIILVTGKDNKDYCQNEIVDKYGIHKVSEIVIGGAQRYHSVYEGIKAASECDYIFIHDGARPFITESIMQRAYTCVREYDACVVGMPVKDTIKLADENGFASSTPKRDLVWSIQTPQAFSYLIIKEAYQTLLEKEKELTEKGIIITDDAMVVETFTDIKVKLVNGSYENIKITTPEDLKIAETFFENIDIY